MSRLDRVVASLGARGRRASRRVRPMIVAQLRRALRRATGSTVIVTEYPVASSPRYGWGDRPPHPALDERFAAGRDGYRTRLASYEPLLPALRAIPRTPAGGQPGWENDYFAGLDAVVLYGELAARRPARYLEVGSGHSTAFVRRAIRDLGLPTTITSIDPSPRAEIDALCDTVHRCGLQDLGAAPFAALEPGDIVLIDGSHNCFMGNDVAVTFLEVLPAIPPGVLVGIDDIFLPWDYPDTWIDRWYAEQYLLAVLLLADTDWKVVLPDFWAVQDEQLASAVAAFDDPARSAKFGLGGVTFWMER